MFSKGREKERFSVCPLFWPTLKSLQCLIPIGTQPPEGRKGMLISWLGLLNETKLFLPKYCANKAEFFPDPSLIKLHSETRDLSILIWANWLSGLCAPAGRWAVNKSGIYSTDVNNLEYLITAHFNLSSAQTSCLCQGSWVCMELLWVYLISLHTSLFSCKKRNNLSPEVLD